MKIRMVALWMVSLVVTGSVMGYPEHQMLFYSMKQGEQRQQPAEVVNLPEAYESRPDGSPSKVLLIQGVPALRQVITQVSRQRPVVMKVYTEKSGDSAKVKPHFQSTADLFDRRVACVAVDLFAEGSQNTAVILSILKKCGVQKVELPLFLFFNQGQLCMPIYQGFNTAENIASVIRARFFDGEGAPVSGDQEEARLSTSPSLDYTLTAHGPRS